MEAKKRLFIILPLWIVMMTGCQYLSSAALAINDEAARKLGDTATYYNYIDVTGNDSLSICKNVIFNDNCPDIFTSKLFKHKNPDFSFNYPYGYDLEWGDDDIRSDGTMDLAFKSEDEQHPINVGIGCNTGFAGYTVEDTAKDDLYFLEENNKDENLKTVYMDIQRYGTREVYVRSFESPMPGSTDPHEVCLFSYQGDWYCGDKDYSLNVEYFPQDYLLARKFINTFWNSFKPE